MSAHFSLKYFMVACGLVSAPFAVMSQCGSLFEGEGTQYGGIAGSNSGNCGIWVDADDVYHCALNHDQYDASNACGACIHAYGPIGDIVVKVVDQCPECSHGDIDFSTGAFVLIAKLEDGRVPIKWQFVPCPLAQQDSSISMKVDDGSSPYYFKAMFYNLYVGLQSVEYLNDNDEWVEIERQDYNYFVAGSGIDNGRTSMGPYSFRLTSWTGEQIVVQNVKAAAGQTFDLAVQFSTPYCDESMGLEQVGADVSVSRVEVYDTMGRLVQVMDEWNPCLLTAAKGQMVFVRQFSTVGVFTQKWMVW